MKYLVSFISNYNKSENKKKSNYELIICDSHEPDISGMITLNNCLVLDKVSFSMFDTNGPEYIQYSYWDEQIIVNREDIEHIKKINDNEVSTFIPNRTKEEALQEAKKLEEESKIQAEADKKAYEDSLETKIESDEITWLIKLKNQIEIFFKTPNGFRP